MREGEATKFLWDRCAQHLKLYSRKPLRSQAHKKEIPEVAPKVEKVFHAILFIASKAEIRPDQCIPIQLIGLLACEKCGKRNTEDCDGRAILKAIACNRFLARGVGIPLI